VALLHTIIHSAMQKINKKKNPKKKKTDPLKRIS
jgi:hypothetical protein